MKYILASKSPRRRELLSNLGLSFEISPSNKEEKTDPALPFSEIVKSLAKTKAEDIFEKYINNINNNEETDLTVIGADTIVVLEGRVLGKPKDKADAYKMLKALSGRSHYVYTGLCLKIKQGEAVKTELVSDKTEVFFTKMTDEEITDYIATGEPMDKAGSYGIQAIGARFIEKINGNYQTVVGLNTARLYSLLKKHSLI